MWSQESPKKSSLWPWREDEAATNTKKQTCDWSSTFILQLRFMVFKRLLDTRSFSVWVAITINFRKMLADYLPTSPFRHANKPSNILIQHVDFWGYLFVLVVVVFFSWSFMFLFGCFFPQLCSFYVLHHLPPTFLSSAFLCNKFSEGVTLKEFIIDLISISR